MKKIISILGVILIMTSAFQLKAQDGYISPVTSYGEDLDLTAVMEVFKESYDLADFERRINQANGINNLDINGDGIVDYIRVSEKIAGRNRYIYLQAILGNSQFQDVAVLNIQRRNSSSIDIQCEGNIDIYGPNYYVEPPYDRYVYINNWPIWRVIFRPHYRHYYSSWRWGYYPRYWRSYRTVRYSRYYERTRPYYGRGSFIYTRNSYRPRYSYRYKRYSRFRNRPARRIHKYRSYATYKHRSGTNRTSVRRGNTNRNNARRTNNYNNRKNTRRSNTHNNRSNTKRTGTHNTRSNTRKNNSYNNRSNTRRTNTHHTRSNTNRSNTHRTSNNNRGSRKSYNNKKARTKHNNTRNSSRRAGKSKSSSRRAGKSRSSSRRTGKSRRSSR